MSTRIVALKERRAADWAKMNELRDAVGERDLTAEERQEWDRIEASIGTLSADIEREERAVRTDAALNAPVEDRHLAGATTGAGEDRTAEEDEARVSRAFGNFMRHGIGRLSAEDRSIMEARFEQRAQGEGTGSAGGYLVPQGYWQRISEVLKAYGGLLSVANVIHTATGQTLPWPNNDDTSNVGGLLGENTQVSETDLTLGTRNLSAYTFTSNLVLVSLQLLQDSAFDLDAFIQKKLGQRIGRAVASYLQTGTGASQPTGLNPTVTAGVTAAAGVLTAAEWAAQANTAAYDNLVDLVHSVDPAYRAGGNCRFVLNDSTVAAVRKIKDGYGHPIWQPSTVAGQPDVLLGYPVTIDQNTPSMAASAKAITFGDHEAGFVVRQCLDVQMMRLTERYADYLQVGFFGFMRLDSHPDDPNAVKALANPAS